MSHFDPFLPVQMFTSGPDSDPNETRRQRTSGWSYEDQEWTRNLLGTVWPASDNDLMDRIQSQDEYSRTYKKWRDARGGFLILKVVYVFGYLYLGKFDGDQTPFRNCPIAHCIATRNQSAMRTADAVLITTYGNKKGTATSKAVTGNTILGHKPRHQIWIAYNFQPPKKDYIDVSLLRNRVNWTMSYRRDSTIPCRFGATTFKTNEEVRSVVC